jgi:acyl-CoA thioesterase I
MNCIKASKAARAASVFGAICALCAALLLGVTARHVRADVDGALRVMPIGDSITQGHQNWGPTYRYELWRLFAATGHDLDFVGSMTRTISGGYVEPNFDQHHEGRNGWRVDQVNAQLDVWMRASQPQVLLVHLGHNDLIQGQTVTSTIDDLDALIDIARAVNPAVMIAIAQPIPCAHSNSFCRAAELAELAQRLPALGLARTSAASRVLIVDMRSDFSIDADLYDGLHPDASGDRKLAERWLAALALRDPATPTPTATPTLTPAATHTATPTAPGGQREPSSDPTATATLAPTLTPTTPPLVATSTATPTVVVPRPTALIQPPAVTVLSAGAPSRRVWLPVIAGNGDANQ